MKLESPQERIDAIRRQADDELQDHQVSKINSSDRVRCYQCAKPGTGMYHFFVTTVPGFVFVSGDIGELVFQPTHNNTLDFCMNGSLSYQLGKLVPEFREQREPLPYLVREALEHQVAAYRENDQLPTALKRLRREVREASYDLEDVNDFYRRLIDIDPDAFEYDVTVPKRGVIYRIFALQWFGRWLAEQEAKAA